MDRDVKFCKSEYLESQHPCKASGALLEGLCPWSTKDLVPVDRDANSSFAIMNLMGLKNEQRPLQYRRPNQQIIPCPTLQKRTAS